MAKRGKGKSKKLRKLLLAQPTWSLKHRVTTGISGAGGGSKPPHHDIGGGVR